MKFAERIDNLSATDKHNGHYHDGFWTARDNAAEIAEQADELITKLFDALCDRHADELVDELKEEYGL